MEVNTNPAQLNKDVQLSKVNDHKVHSVIVTSSTIEEMYPETDDTDLIITEIHKHRENRSNILRKSCAGNTYFLI